MIHAVYHLLAWTWGGDGWGGQSGTGYLIVSGPFADLTIIAGIGTFYWKHTCHVSSCWRLGRHSVDGTPYIACRKHHPTVPDLVTAAHVARAHQEHQDQL